jgi:hypothetical protein
MIIREVIKPGLTVYKVFHNGALMFYGSCEKTAKAVEEELNEKATPSNDGEQQV